MKIKHDNLFSSILVIAWILAVIALFVGGAWIYSNVKFSAMQWIAVIGINKVIIASIIVYLVGTILKIYDCSAWALLTSIAGFSITALTIVFIYKSNQEPGIYGWSLFFAAVVAGLTNVLFLKAEREPDTGVEKGRLTPL